MNKNFKHGHAKRKSKTYCCWCDMKQRCGNPNNKSYKYYGKRGITICERWLASFIFFLKDMGEAEGLTLDRIDNDKGYYKENCKWSTRKEQISNRRTYGSSQYRGVSFHTARKKWVAQGWTNKNKYHIGEFKSEIEAAKAYNKYIVENNLPNKLNDC